MVKKTPLVNQVFTTFNDLPKAIRIIYLEYLEYFTESQKNIL